MGGQVGGRGVGTADDGGRLHGLEGSPVQGRREQAAPQGHPAPGEVGVARLVGAGEPLEGAARVVGELLRLSRPR